MYICLYISILYILYIGLSQLSSFLYWFGPFLQETAIVLADEEEAGESESQGDDQMAPFQEDAVEDSEGDADLDEEEGEQGERPARRKPTTRVHVSIYQKVLAIREVDRLIEAGEKTCIEKKVMQTFPNIFMGSFGSFKTGMLGRWISQADNQNWRSVPWEKMSLEDRNRIKELPDWIRAPLGLLPRSLDRWKSGSNVPPCVVASLVKMVEKVTCGGATANLTAGTVHTKAVKEDCQRLLDEYAEAQRQSCVERGISPPEAKLAVSSKWVNRLFKTYGWKRNTPNTMGAYLEYEDERMEKSRKAWSFLRPGTTPCCNLAQILVRIYIYIISRYIHI